uniref:Telomeric repeat-binding factor 2-like n=1 Tax=Cucumis melo TaxID=3656 RepID=A0A9I9E0M6_CUCME
MDGDICRWIIEFILRTPMDHHLQKKVMAAVPLPDKDFRLTKTVLLESIESEIFEAVVTEKLLESFEYIEQLDKAEGLAIMESMKAAYCAVAVECTVKFLLVEGIQKDGRYFDAVRRIWSGRVANLERSGKSKLVSRELKAWKDEFELSLCDKNVRLKLVHMNTRYDALKLTRDYLTEAWAVIGPSFIQLSASLMDKRVVNEMQSTQLEKVKNKMATESEVVGGSDEIELPSQSENYARPERQGGGEVLSQPETRNDLLNRHQDLSTSEGSKQPATVATTTERVQELAAETAEGEELVEKEVAVLHYPSPRRENVKTSAVPRCKSLAFHRRVRGGAKISQLEDLENENDNLFGRYTCLDTPEVNRVREALKASSLELQAAVSDPLPDALRVAESVANALAEKKKTCEHSSEGRTDAGSSNPTINKYAVPLQSVSANLKNLCNGRKIIFPRPSIMERNSTACTYEWNDSIDDLPEGSNANRLRLPSPKRKDISPLKKYEETKVVRRRQCKKWSLLEEDTLRTAVQRFGKGNWKLILSSYRDIFDERTEVDLKDKWRNMTRY